MGTMARRRDSGMVTIGSTPQGTPTDGLMGTDALPGKVSGSIFLVRKDESARESWLVSPTHAKRVS